MCSINVLSGYTKNSDQPLTNAVNVVVFNLMPNRLETEKQIINTLQRTPQNFNITFCLMESHHFKNFDQELFQKYATLTDIKDQYFDALIVTGAPVDRIGFLEVDYWNEFNDLLQWRKTHVRTSLFSCWSAWAAGSVDKILVGNKLRNKISGVYNTNGFTMPHSRYFKIPLENVSSKARIIAGNEKIGATIVFYPELNSYYVTGHFEYSTTTLANEFYRDLKNQQTTKAPENYFNENAQPINSWYKSADYFFNNWLKQFDKVLTS